MGQLLSALSSAASAVSGGVGSVTGGAKAPGTPAANPMSMLMPADPAPAPAPIAVPAAPDTGNDDALSALGIPDPMGMSGNPSDLPPAPTPTPAPMDTQPYDDMGANPAQDMAKDIGSSGDAQEAVDIKGDSWKPEKESTLGRIGDLFLGNAFHNRTVNHNMQSAMQGMEKDPLLVIDRMRRMGEPGAAWRMLEKYQQEHKDDDLMQQKVSYYTNLNKKAGYLQIANQLGAVEGNDPGAVYDKIRPSLLSTAKNYNIDPSEIPDRYDPDLVNTLRDGAVEAKDQMALAQRKAHDTFLEQQEGRRTDLQASRVGMENRGTAAQIDNVQNEMKNRDAGTVETNRAHVASETQNNPFGILDKDGTQLGTVNPKDNTAVLRAPDGAQYKFEVVKINGRWRLGKLIKGGVAKKNPDGSLNLSPGGDDDE